MIKYHRGLLILLLFLILTLLFTYPLFFKINSYIPGFDNTDEPYWSLWYSWWSGYSFNNNLNFTFSPLLAAPFGLDLGRQMYPVWDFISRLLVIEFGPISAYNFQIIFSLVFSAFFMYLLVYSLTDSRMAGILSGIIYSFSPYHMVRLWQHLNLIQIEWLALLVLMLCKLREKNSLRNSIFVGLSFSVIALFSLYYVYLALIIIASFIAFTVIFDKERRLKIFKPISVSALISFLLLIPIFLPVFNYLGSIQAGGEWGYARPFENLFSQAAKPLSYLLPVVDHPFFGKFTENFVGTQLYGLSLTEHALYLGWIALILAFFAFKRWRSCKKKKQGQSPFGDSPCLAPEAGFYIGFFIFLAIIAWFFSQPPWWQIGPLKIFMPSFFMYKLLPMFRAYCRFGIVVMLAVAVLAGFGLKFILDRFKSRKSKVAVTAFFCSLVLFEFWNWPPYKVIDVSRVPAVYYWLKAQAQDFTIAEYPLDAVAPDQMYRFYQITHEKKIINDTVPGTAANNLAKTLTQLSEPRTAGILKWMQVKYVIVHRDRYLYTGLIRDKEEFSKISQNTGLRLIKTFSPQECPQKDIMCIQETGPIDVYEVTASPIKPEIKE